MKPPKKAPQKPPKYATALVPFQRIGDAFNAVSASGRADRGLAEVEVSWAEGNEPAVLGWLRSQGKLGYPSQDKCESRTQTPRKDVPVVGGNGPSGVKSGTRPHHSDSQEGSRFSSFPSTFVGLPVNVTMLPNS